MSSFSIREEDRFIAWRSLTPSSAHFQPKLADATSHTRANFAKREEALAFCTELRELAEDASVDGWNGRGSVALDRKSFTKMAEMLEALPTNFPFPSPSVMPDGRLILEWASKPSAAFAAVLGHDSKMHYSLYTNGLRTHGSFNFAGDELPSEFVLAAKRWLKANRA